MGPEFGTYIIAASLPLTQSVFERCPGKALNFNSQSVNEVPKMLPVVESSVRDALVRAQALDSDIVKLAEFSPILESVKIGSDGAVDEKSLSDAIVAMKKAKPGLFHVSDFLEMSDAQFDKAEKTLRERLRRPRETTRGNEFKSLDCAMLTDEEMASLRRYLSGNRNTWDRAVLVNAQRRQTSTGPEAA